MLTVQMALWASLPKVKISQIHRNVYTRKTEERVEPTERPFTNQITESMATSVCKHVALNMFIIAFYQSKLLLQLHSMKVSVQPCSSFQESTIIDNMGQSQQLFHEQKGTTKVNITLRFASSLISVGNHAFKAMHLLQLNAYNPVFQQLG